MKIIARDKTDFYTGSDVWHVASDRTGHAFRICVTPPAYLPSDGVKFGAVYALDAEWSAGVVAGALRALGGNEIPFLYGIAIGYPADINPPAGFTRVRDYTPTKQSENAKFMSLPLGLSDEIATGGADSFLDFIIQELRPFLENEYPLNPDDTILTGCSLGGLFTLHSFLSKPESFKRYLPISPSLWWDDKVTLKHAEKLLSCHIPANVEIAMFAAELEDVKYVEDILRTYFAPEVVAQMPSEMRHADIIGDMQQMHETLRKWENKIFRVHSAIIPRESHQSIMGGAALSQGLRKFYGRLDDA